MTSKESKYCLRNKRHYRKEKEPESSDSSSSEDDTIYTSSSEIDDSEETEYTECAEEDESEEPAFDHKKLHKALATLFPSKYMNAKVENDRKETEMQAKLSRKKKGETDRIKEKDKSSRRDSSRGDKDREKDKEKEKEKSHRGEKDRKSARPSKKRHVSRNRKSDSEASDIDIEDSEEEVEEDLANEGGQQKYNIIFHIGGAEEDDDDYFEDSEDYPESEEDETCNSDDEKTFMRETYVEEETLPPEEEPAVSSPSKPETSKKSGKHKPKLLAEEDAEPAENDSDNTLEDIESEYLELVDLKKRLSQELAKKPKNKILKHSIQECKDSISALIKKARKANTKKYHRLVHIDTKPANEMEYFKTKLSNKEQRKAMEDLKEINAYIYTDKPYRLSLLQSKMSAKFKAIAMQKLNILKSMDPSDHEYYKIKNWVDTFMKIPFGLYKSVSVSFSDGLPKCNEFITEAKRTLDECAFGLNDAKMQIMQMLGQLIVNPLSVGTAIAIHGPMGTGKTTLVKEGISKILGREFAFIALGGSGDSSFLEGHSYTYEGSTWGKIVQILIESKCMNPVIYFDELDKVSDTPRGQEIIGILTHLTDTTQNNQFHDKYFSEIDFDLSKCLFIFSYNDESMVNPILRDRMYRIRTKGYDVSEKLIIARQHLLPKIREQVKFSEEDVVLSDEMIKYMIATFTKNESGVRNLKRCLEMIYSKLNLFRLVSPENKLFTSEMSLEVKFPLTITRKEIDVFIKTDDIVNQSLLSMYI